MQIFNITDTLICVFFFFCCKLSFKFFANQTEALPHLAVKPKVVHQDAWCPGLTGLAPCDLWSSLSDISRDTASSIGHT